MARADNWVGSWIISRIKHDNITSVTLAGSNLILVNAINIDYTIKVAVISVETVNYYDITDVLIDPEIEFIINLKKGAEISKEALEYCRSIPVGVGSLGDFYSAIDEQDLRNYISKEVRFILRGLGQHTAVSQAIQISSNKYSITLHNLNSVILLSLYDYDVTAETIRSGLEQYGKCDIILACNPNSRISPEASEASKSCGVFVLKWKELLGVLNHR